MLNYSFPLFICIGLLMACNNSNPNTAGSGKFSAEQLREQQKLWDDLMAVHDEVMPGISNIHKLGRQLRNYADTTAFLAPEESEKITATVQMLDNADESMFSWMNNLRQLKPLQDTEKHQTIVAYLQEEQKKMAKVKEDMLKSIYTGNALLKELEIIKQQ